MSLHRALAYAIATTSLCSATAEAQQSRLHLEKVAADSTAFDVIATLIVGPTEVLVWDAQYTKPFAKLLADRIAATGKRLQAIVLSHPDHDHYAGAAEIVERFPGTPVYISAAGLAWFKEHAPSDFGKEKSQAPSSLADSLVTPRVLPSTRFTVDGEIVDVMPDLAGDVITPSNSVLWIPSLRAALVADIAFDKVHPWLGSSDEKSRQAWARSLQRVADLKPLIVVAGHKKDVNAPDSPAVLDEMRRYLADFDSVRKKSSTAQELAAAMKARYADYAIPSLLNYAARMAFRAATPD